VYQELGLCMTMPWVQGLDAVSCPRYGVLLMWHIAGSGWAGQSVRALVAVAQVVCY
jgi:hypothetical protein